MNKDILNLASLPVSDDLAAEVREDDGRIFDGSTDSLTLPERELIELFVSFADLLSLPRSVAEIYGLLFCSADPLNLDDIADRLRISRGSASQGLRFLRNTNAIQPVYLPGERKDHYVAESSLRRALGGFLRERVQPRLEDGGLRLDRIEALLKSQPQLAPHLRERVQRLRTWSQKAKGLMPFLGSVIGP